MAEQWRCVECGCRVRAFMDEHQPVRCVSCKRETTVPDYKAAVRDLEDVLDRILAFYIPERSSVFKDALTVCKRHAAAIAAAKGDK